MKKIIFVTLAFIIFLSSIAHASDATLFDMRNKIFAGSKKIKGLLGTSKDRILLNSLWDSCRMAMSRIDAYYQMIRIFNTIKKEDMTEDAINTLISWLNEIKSINELNIKTLDGVSQTIEPRTKIHVETLKVNFVELKDAIDAELKKVLILRTTLELKKK
ncbi:hypothetical protein ACFL0P_03575 [Candidatus Omnitrophota bacterium]